MGPATWSWAARKLGTGQRAGRPAAVCRSTPNSSQRLPLADGTRSLDTSAAEIEVKMRPPGFFERFAFAHIVFAIFVSLLSALGALVVSYAQFRGDVNCDEAQVLTFLYNHSRMSWIANVREVSFEGPARKRTCIADAVVDGRPQKLTFVIDTSDRGQAVEPLPIVEQFRQGKLIPDLETRYNKFSISYVLHD
jgi:hypothetical protein